MRMAMVVLILLVAAPLFGAGVAIRGTAVNQGVPAVELPVSPVESTITITCSLAICSDGTPSSKWDQPSCADYELNTALIESAQGGDRSALTLLRQRFDTADTYLEQHRIGQALLGKLADDRCDLERAVRGGEDLGAVSVDRW